MAIPGTPPSVTVRPGHNPGDVIVECGDSTNTPLTYTAYINNATGVDSSSAFRAKRKSTATRFVFRNKHTWRKVFATVTATNASGTSSDGTEASGKARI